MNCIALLSLFVLAVSANNYGYAAPPALVRSSSHSGYAAVPAAVPAAPASFSVSSPVLSTFKAAPVGEIVRLHHEIKQDQLNSVRFDTSNGIQVVDETKVLAGTPNPENPSELWNKIAKSGSYSYTSPEGTPISIQWTADGVHGFRATGSAIPTPPAVPAAADPAAPAAPGSGYRY